MLKVDLITGFLGAGKTTFIHGYLKYLHSKGISVRLIENEFGPVSVDTAMLKQEDNCCAITDLTGLCMCCTGRDEFIYQLCEAARTGADRVIVEPSGIYDVDEFFSVMDVPQVSDVCEIGSIITIADAGAVLCPTEESRYLSFCQLLSAGCILLSKTQLSRNSAETAKESIRELMASFGCPDGPAALIWDQPWDQLTDADYETLMNAGCSRFIHERKLFSHSDTFQTAALAVRCRSKADLEGRIRRLFRSAACGKIFRVKGFVRGPEGLRFEVNCTAGSFSISETSSKQKLLVVIGQHLNEEAAARMLGGEEEAAE